MCTLHPRRLHVPFTVAGSSDRAVNKGLHIFGGAYADEIRDQNTCYAAGRHTNSLEPRPSGTCTTYAEQHTPSARNGCRGETLEKCWPHCAPPAGPPDISAHRPPNPTKSGQDLTELSPNRADVDRPRPSPGRFGPTSAKSWPDLSEFGGRRAEFTPNILPEGLFEQLLSNVQRAIWRSMMWRAFPGCFISAPAARRGSIVSNHVLYTFQKV